MSDNQALLHALTTLKCDSLFSQSNNAHDRGMDRNANITACRVILIPYQCSDERDHFGTLVQQCGAMQGGRATDARIAMPVERPLCSRQWIACHRYIVADELNA